MYEPDRVSLRTIRELERLSTLLVATVRPTQEELESDPLYNQPNPLSDPFVSKLTIFGGTFKPVPAEVQALVSAPSHRRRRKSARLSAPSPRQAASATAR
jgi:hypothetical protein